jgi:predicted CoA-substrate-specific enzyme activase
VNLYLGVDVGAIGIKGVLMVPQAHSGLLAPQEREALGLRRIPAARQSDCTLWALPTKRTRGRPLEATRDLLSDLLASLPADAQVAMLFTGAGGRSLAEALRAGVCNEFQACARAIDELYPQVRTVFEMGGETSRYLRLSPDPASGRLSIVDYGTNGDCAAGTGSFLDQQANRLNYAVEDIGQIVATAGRAAQIAGRCSVFAKSDMIHAQQKGFQPPEVLRGLCSAVATNFKSAVVKGRPVEPPVAFVGGVAANTAVIAALKEAFDLQDGDLLVPPLPDSIGAAGAALLASERRDCPARSAATWRAYLSAASKSDGRCFPTVPPLSLERVRLLRDQVRPYRFPDQGPVDAWLGLDIGSVGTKLVLIDDHGDVIYSIFTRTEGRPIAVVARGLREIEQAVGERVRIRGVGSTGSGRELIGELVGADSITDEITCHKTGAVFVGDRLLGRRPDTIFEIGGQDSKYISLQEESTDGRHETIVVDFTMNEACAAGTGSFLEERAAELGVSIKDEFARLAFSSRAPIRLGERCTVFMERDVNTYMQRGARLEDIIAGLAYSVAWNYINRVVRRRPIGNCIFFQGGTAYNDAVAAAFSIICDREIIVPPYTALLGAIGAALLAREKITRTGTQTRFRGYNLDRVDYSFREFTCKGCANYCPIQEFNVCGEKTYWGDKCSERYRKQAKTSRKPVIPDLIALRQRLLTEDESRDPTSPRGVIGVPLAMYTWDYLPMWRRFFRECGFSVAVSDPTNRLTVSLGLDCVVAEPCFPIIVAHGHATQLMRRGVDFLWLPNLLTAPEKHPELESHVCPWGSTLPFVVRQAPAFRGWRGCILCPTISLQRGKECFCEQMIRVARRLGVPKRLAQRAFESAWAAQQRFRTAYEEAGRKALQTLTQTGEPGMVLVGRPYNIHDAGVSLAIARKLRELYGVNVLPVDCLPLSDIDIRDVNDNMYWAYGRRILAAAKLVAQYPNLHIIYVTNFKCGPDSFIKGFIRPASGKPFLTLQFDGHSNDAGMMTRAEAYLDSKGILRWWRSCPTPPLLARLPEEPSTSRRWPMPVRAS